MSKVKIGTLEVKWIINLMALLSLFIGMATCNADAPSSVATVESSLRDALSAIEGKYVWSNETKRYVFSDKQRLEEIISKENREQVLSILVNCLDDISPSQSLLDGKRVPLGVICYEALTQMAYYEPIDSRGDVAKKWGGYISPKATLKELRAAKKAWVRVLAKKSYIFL